VGSVRTINTAEVTYASTYPDVGFSLLLASLGGDPATACKSGTAATKTSACIIDNVLAQGSKSGYSLVAVGAPDTGATTNTSYLVTAVPQTLGTTGTRSFCSDQSGVIYNNPAGVIAATDAACVALKPLQ
jgi:type IV pilus assembly protein PilA